jgi:hypothetical protein
MKFVRKETIVTTVFNKEITELDEIKIILNNLYNNKVEFSIMFKRNVFNKDTMFLSMEKAVIKKINEDNIDFFAFKNGAKTVVNNLLFSDIIEINATTVKNKILDFNSDATRFDYLDL